MNITHAHEKVNELSMCGNTTSKKDVSKKWYKMNMLHYQLISEVKNYNKIVHQCSLTIFSNSGF